MSLAIANERSTDCVALVMEKLRVIDSAATDINRLAINASVETLHAAGFIDDFERVIGENLAVEANLLDICTEGGRQDELPGLCTMCGVAQAALSDAAGNILAAAPHGVAGGKIPKIFLKAAPGKPIVPRAVQQADGTFCKFVGVARREGGVILAVERYAPPGGRLTIDSFGIVARQVKSQADLIRGYTTDARRQGERLEQLTHEQGNAGQIRELRDCCRMLEIALSGIAQTARLVNLLGIRAAIEAAQSTNDKDDFDKLLSAHMTVQARLAAELFSAEGITHARAEEIMRRVGLDEVWITDGGGKVVLSNVPNGEGFVFTRQGQTGPYMRILDQPDLVVTAPPAVRPFDGKVFKFVGVARKGAQGILQVGRQTRFYGQSTAKGFEIVSQDIKRMAVDLQSSVSEAETCVIRIGATM